MPHYVFPYYHNAFTNSLDLDFDTTNIVLLAVQFAATYAFAQDKLGHFDPHIRYEVYDQLNYNIQKAQPLKLRLSADGIPEGLMNLVKQKDEIIDIVNYQHYIFNITLVNIILMMLRMLKILDFQPRIALVTKTIEAAASDLFHFSILFTALHAGFSTCGMILFGIYAEDFTTFGNSVRTLFSILIGNSDVDDRLSASEASTLWTGFYLVYLLISFFVLFNIFLAIIIDGYVNISSQTGEAPTIVQEFTCMINNFLRFLQNPRKYQSDEAIIKMLEGGLESDSIENSADPLVGRRNCRLCCAKTSETDKSPAVSKITPMHLQHTTNHALDHNEASSVRLSKYLDIEDRFVHFNANQMFLNVLLQEIGVEKDKVRSVSNAILDKLPRFDGSKGSDEGQDLQKVIAVRALRNTTMEATNSLTDAALQNKQAILSARSQVADGNRSTGNSAKNAWSQ